MQTEIKIYQHCLVTHQQVIFGKRSRTGLVSSEELRVCTQPIQYIRPPKLIQKDILLMIVTKTNYLYMLFMSVCNDKHLHGM